MLLLSGSPKPKSLIKVLENGGGICCSRPRLILCGGSVLIDVEPLSAHHLWQQLVFQFHQQINDLTFKKDTIVFALSVLIKK